MSLSIRLAKRSQKDRRRLQIVSVILVTLLVTGYFILRRANQTAGHFLKLRQYRSDPVKFARWGLNAGERCKQAPFLQPTDGFVAFFWGDRYGKHQGIDIFGPENMGVTPVVAAYDGFLTRLTDWMSAVIIRIPDDPLEPGRQIWTYYTHMADAQGNTFISDDFPTGTFDVPVKAGTFLGFQGNFSADPDNPTGVHLHFSIVHDDGKGNFLNELEIRNTLDPSAYLSLELNADRIGDGVAACEAAS